MRTQLCIWLILGVFACGDSANDDDGTDASSSRASASSSGQGGHGGEAGTGGSGGQAPVIAPDPVAFRATAPMATKRSHHTATLLEDGRVLVVGGETGSHTMIDAVEIFDPATETWQTLGPLPEARSNHTATRLHDGRVLITGGGSTSAIGVPNGVTAFDTALLFDPATASFTPTGAMSAKRADHRAALLADGRVLVVGGATEEVSEPCTVVPNCTVGVALASADVFDPITGTFTPVAPMSEPRYSTVTATLKDGRVVVAGGVDGVTSLRTAEVFDPAASAFTATADLQFERLFAAGAMTGSGKLVVAGGKRADIAPHKKTEVYDPAAATWTVVGDLSQRRTGAQALTLASGRIIHIGGYDQGANEDLPNVEIFDETTGAWTRIGDLAKARSLAASAVLADGRVLVTGGGSGSGVLGVCEIGQP